MVIKKMVMQQVHSKIMKEEQVGYSQAIVNSFPVALHPSPSNKPARLMNTAARACCVCLKCSVYGSMSLCVNRHHRL